MKNTANLNFNGGYQGLISGGHSLHKYPKKTQYACPYADRLMFDIASKALLSKDYKNNVKVSLLNSAEGKKLSFEIFPSTVKKLIPFHIKITRGNGLNLNAPFFWNMIKEKRIKKIKYELSEEDLKKDINYFTKPKTATEILTNSIEDAAFNTKIKKLKTSLMKTFENKQERLWINEFFSKAN